MRCKEEHQAMLGETVRCVEKTQGHPFYLDGRGTLVHRGWTPSGDHLEWKTTPTPLAAVEDAQDLPLP